MRDSQIMLTSSTTKILTFSLQPPMRTAVRRMGKVGFWWGHETPEDRAAARKHKEDMQVIHWRTEDSAVGDVKTATYTPMRVDKEENALNVGPDISRARIPDYYGWTAHPKSLYAMVVEPNIWEYNKRIKAYNKLLKNQRFMRERLLALGPDLCAAHFLVARGCRVKFLDQADWVGSKEYRNLPIRYEKGWYVEAIDASNSSLIYEGIQNIRNLIYLKKMDISYCDQIDSFCMDRITGEYQDSLEELDLSGCRGLSMHNLECLWRLRKLKVLTLRDLDHIKDLKLLCLMLLEELPDLEIRGVDYADPQLLEGTEHENLLKEFEELLLEPGTDRLGAAVVADDQEDTSESDQLRPMPNTPNSEQDSNPKISQPEDEVDRKNEAATLSQQISS